MQLGAIDQLLRYRWQPSSWLLSSLLERTIITLMLLLLRSNIVTYLDSS
jgi:hypothetical protein